MAQRGLRAALCWLFALLLLPWCWLVGGLLDGVHPFALTLSLGGGQVFAFCQAGPVRSGGLGAVQCHGLHSISCFAPANLVQHPAKHGYLRAISLAGCLGMAPASLFFFGFGLWNQPPLPDNQWWWSRD